jgi:hypothetical protein
MFSRDVCSGSSKTPLACAILPLPSRPARLFTTKGAESHLLKVLRVIAWCHGLSTTTARGTESPEVLACLLRGPAEIGWTEEEDRDEFTYVWRASQGRLIGPAHYADSPILLPPTY